MSESHGAPKEDMMQKIIDLTMRKLIVRFPETEFVGTKEGAAQTHQA